MYIFPAENHSTLIITIRQTETGLLLIISFTYQIQKCKLLLINVQMYKDKVISVDSSTLKLSLNILTQNHVLVITCESSFSLLISQTLTKCILQAQIYECQDAI